MGRAKRHYLPGHMWHTPDKWFTPRWNRLRPREIGSTVTSEFHRASPREIIATEISPQYNSSYLQGRHGRRGKHFIGQVGQAEFAEV